MKSALLTLMTWLLCFALSGQKDSWISVRGSTGAFLPHRISLPQLLTDKASAFELKYSRTVDGSEAWHHYFKGPRKGIGFFVMDMGNPEELGNIYSVYPFVDLPLDKGGSGRVLLHMGVGLAYLNKKYDYDENFFNKAIGSHINYGIVLGLNYEYAVKRFRFGTGLSITHASNAAIQLPNLGVNVASLDFSLAYRLNDLQEETLEVIIPAWTGQSEFSVMTSFGFRESSSITREKHGVQELRGMYSRKFSSKSSYRLGADLIHNRASYQNLTGGSEQEFAMDVLQSGIFLGITLDFGNASMYFNNGVYLTQGFQEEGAIYHRFGGLWKVNDRFTLDLCLKTHFAKADYLAFGIGYSLASNKIGTNE
ncbi:MAG: acyloxyacyl hydrolase [Flavobacteriales bacterium]|nr:acyloxyacyl hydrolase [Flavobacteriales bacterium]NNK81329.1 acyloxyacyl hydrolase [Flavobacteriales bacterium]